MKKKALALALLSGLALLTACAPAGSAPPAASGPAEPALSTVQRGQKIELSIGGADLEVTWEDNEAVAALAALLEDGELHIRCENYGGFEQVGPLPQRLPASDSQTSTAPGDIVLYTGSQIVLFYGSNTWAYTRLGHIDGLSDDELSALLGGAEAEIVLRAVQ